MSVTLSRPRILTRAAKAGASLYRRERDLAKIAPLLFARARGRKWVVEDLVEAEAECEVERRSGAANYSIERHISLLAALFAEASATNDPMVHG